jgi:hypothetical protein
MIGIGRKDLVEAVNDQQQRLLRRCLAQQAPEGGCQKFADQIGFRHGDAVNPK